MAEGTKSDSGKPRWELLPYDAVEEVVKVLTEGAKKYDDRNWEQGIKYSRVFAAAQRHMSAFWRGNDINQADFNLHHIAHAATSLLMLLAYELRDMTKWDDRPNIEKGGDTPKKPLTNKAEESMARARRALELSREFGSEFERFHDTPPPKLSWYDPTDEITPEMLDRGEILTPSGWQKPQTKERN